MEQPNEGFSISESPPKESESNPKSSPVTDTPPPLRVGGFEAINSIVLAFGIEVNHPPQEQSSFNDDVFCAHYEGSLDSYMGAQRNKLNIDSLGANSRSEFVHKSMDRPSPFAEVPPIPEDIKRSINFLPSNDTAEIVAFWERQLGNLRSLISGREERSRAWYAYAPPELAKFRRRLPLDAWAALLQLCGLGGSTWLNQFAHGFPITGTLSQKFAFPAATQKLPAQLPLNTVLASNASRFASRAARTPPQADLLWSEAMDQVARGWLDSPRLLNRSGAFADDLNAPLNVAFRFAVAQSSKVRACEDLKDSLTNRLCAAETPIALPDWDLLAAMSLFSSSLSKKDWAFLKGDDTSAYKNLPLKPSDAHLAAIGLWGSRKKGRFAFLPRTLLFGATASVLRYNVFSRMLAVIFNRLFGIPLIAFYDDLGAQMIRELSERALHLVYEVCGLLGVVLNWNKCDCGNPLPFLGLIGSFPMASNNWKLSIALAEEKIWKWSSQIQHFLQVGKISFADLQKLIGELSFAQATVFGECARAVIRPLYAWLYSAHFSAVISAEITEILLWWIRLLQSFRPRIVTFRPKYPEFVIFTDASYKDGVGRISAFLFRRGEFRANESALAMASLVVPAYVLKFFADALPIFALEFFAIVLALFEWKTLIQGATTTLYTDDTGAFGAVLNTGSSAVSVSRVTMRLWYLLAQFRIWLWLEPVASHLNIADLPTRGKPSPFKVNAMTGFSLLEDAFAFFTQISISEFLRSFTDSGIHAAEGQNQGR